MRNYQPNKSTHRNTTERRGTLRRLAERLNLATQHWNPPYFGGFVLNSLIFLAPDAPFPNAHLGNGARHRAPDT